MPRLAVKIDVDTDRGTREGVPPLAHALLLRKIPATFLFSLGPDNTGRAIRRIFRPGFFSKVSRTSVVSTYGLRTLMNGVLLPGPDIAKRNAALMRDVRSQGFETGIHCWDHVYWQDHLHTLPETRVAEEFSKARRAYAEIFGEVARIAGAAGWQASEASLKAYDEAGLLYASDMRGRTPFFPIAGGKHFATLQIPTTLPTLDELMGRPEYPDEKLAGEILSRLRPDTLNVFTVHAEIEGMSKLSWFGEFLDRAIAEGVSFVSLMDEARRLRAQPQLVEHAYLVQGEVDGRSGQLAVQGETQKEMAA